MNSATGASVLAQEMPTSKSFFLECNCKIYVRFHDKDLAINFGRGYAYAMRQRDFENSWAQYEVRHPGFKRGADFANKMRLWARRWGLPERWNPVLFREKGSGLTRERGF